MGGGTRKYYILPESGVDGCNGSKRFVEGIKEQLGIWARGRKVRELRGVYHLREAQAACNSNFTLEKGVLSAKNTCFWNVNL